MIERAHGLIVRTRPFAETSLIVHWLTPEFGRINTIAKGARRPKSPFRGKLDLFYRAEFSFSRSRRSELHTLCEVSLRDTYPALRRDLGYLEQAAYAVALIEQVAERETPLPALYELAQGLLDFLPRQPPLPHGVLAFELKLLRDLGLKPDLTKSDITPGARKIAEALLPGDWSAVSRVKLTAAQLDELRKFLHGFLVYHLGKIPRGRPAW